MIQHRPLPQRNEMILLTAALILGFIICFYMTRPFLPALVWAITLAMLFAPIEARLRRKFGKPTLSASLAMVLAAVIVVAPVLFIVGALLNKAVESTSLLHALLSTENWPGLTRDYPEIYPAMTWIAAHLDLPKMMQSLNTQFTQWVASLVQGSLSGAVTLLLTFYFLFYLLRDRNTAIRAIERVLPLSDTEFAMVRTRLRETVIASVYGLATVSALQGFLGGLMFWWLDLPSPVFWGVIMGLLAIVPFLGAFVIWLPTSLALAFAGQYVPAVTLALWGTLVVGLVDNIVYPVLVGRRLAQHSIMAFIAIVGGLVVFGAHGIVLGPIVLAASQCLLEIWRSRMDRIPIAQQGKTQAPAI
ncbi:AI-2E family transporter [Novosphingobium sp.]|uniref:AI-2E family transporter n=1 Tax=Novosphingobium sp. TaxID=1874826 RepID=UPI0025CFB21E|nr:AI-2E family transporter [Novosphingobium sp.]